MLLRCTRTAAGGLGLLLVLLGATACDLIELDDRDPDGGFSIPTQPVEPPPAPRFVTSGDDAVPSVTPYPLLPVRIRASDASVLFIRGGDDPVIQDVNVSDTICVTVPLREPGSFVLEARSQNREGLVSEPATFEVTYDPDAPDLPLLADCTTGTQVGLFDCRPAAAETRCGDGLDDDCDGLIDMFDDDCEAPCEDDVLERTAGGTETVPVESGLFRGMQLCEGPTDRDRYRFSIPFGGAAEITIAAQALDAELSVEVTDLETGEALLVDTTLPPSAREMRFHVVEALYRQQSGVRISTDAVLEVRAVDGRALAYDFDLRVYTPDDPTSLVPPPAMPDAP